MEHAKLLSVYLFFYRPQEESNKARLLCPRRPLWRWSHWTCPRCVARLSLTAAVARPLFPQLQHRCRGGGMDAEPRGTPAHVGVAMLPFRGSQRCSTVAQQSGLSVRGGGNVRPCFALSGFKLPVSQDGAW
ncbi:hypothetical protein, unlikely [Trypanosoma brucei gambiense DAL972]|uniref:Uncharacterized protein n=1 Tax=Trypanosoma brucei gambiense (strain MHOM/CI/86/DAL972) TaxID=679716 RepID=D0A6D8_TRYB9|nr:hypothetical protein, unlikely [Trypanosoma brucei gambiense DAL972]CBH17239.1 hypothetical protein, unlikely [Trypanosoma brucei gambiense DAL972]|eukprot:XP_011779503.1 hypothetical protein, unlikely [Trypanosoma brucei gambiense DAL972]